MTPYGIANSSNTSLSELLFAHTQEVHRRSTTGMEKALFGSFSPQGYISVLQRMYGFYRSFEEQFDRFSPLEEWVELAIALDERRKVPLLQTDLLTLGIPAEAQHQIPLCPLPRFETVAQLQGLLWVVEGATQGYQRTARRIEAALLTNAATSFFRSYGSPREVKEMWSSFCQALDFYSTSRPYNTHIIRQTALEVFLRAEQWLFPEG